MKSNQLLKSMILFLSLVLMLGTALGMQPGEVQAETLDNGVTISALDEEGDRILPLTTVSFDTGDSAFNVLEAATDKQGVNLGAEEHEEFGMMIKAIGDVEADDTHYWAFLTQGKAAQKGASSYQVESGDHITFKFASKSDQSDTSGMTVSVRAEGGDNQPVIEETDVELSPGATAYDALYQAADKKKTELNAAVDDQSFIEVTNIGQTELAKDADWRLTVNGDAVQQSSVQHSLNDGDAVEFKVQSADGSSDDNNQEETDGQGDAGKGDDASEQQPDEPDASTGKAVQDHMDALFDYADQNIAMEYGSETWLWGLAHTDYNIPDSYIDSVKEEVNNADGNFRGLELQKIIIALSLLGEDATDFAGYNLLDLLFKQSTPLINGSIYTLLAVDSGEYDAPEAFREDLIKDILKAEIEGGGWAFFGDKPTVDITSMALAALAPYQDQTDVKKASDRAVQYLSEAQEDNGGFYNEINGGDTSESVSQAIVGLTSLGIDPTGAQFTKGGTDLLDHLSAFKRDDGGFAHIIDDADSSAMSTPQALLAYVAYDKLKNNTGLVYQQSATDNDGGSGEEGSGEGSETPGESEGPADGGNEGDNNDNQGTPEEESGDNNDNQGTPEEESGDNNDNQETQEDQSGDDKENNDESGQDPETSEDSSDQNGNNKDGTDQGLVSTKSTDNGESGDETGEKLPETATPMYTYIAIGLALVMAGVVVLLIKRRRSSNA